MAAAKKPAKPTHQADPKPDVEDVTAEKAAPSEAEAAAPSADADADAAERGSFTERLAQMDVAEVQALLNSGTLGERKTAQAKGRLTELRG